MTFLTEYNNNLGIGIRTQTSDTTSGELNFYYIENIPLQNVHGKLGLQVKLHPGMKDSVDFLALCVKQLHTNIYDH